MIISVHLPKTAGTSLIKTLESLCAGEVMMDYSDRPLNRTDKERKIAARINRIKNRWKKFENVACIHGHFMPYKYLSVTKNTLFITWLRDPVERLASHYYFWMNNYDKEQAFRLQRKIVEEKWSFEQFAFSMEMQNTYTKFLWKFPMNKFDFIGITEYYAEDLTYFTKKYFNREPHIFEENLNTQKTEKYITDIGLRKEIEQFHSNDMDLFRMALKNKESRKPL